MIPSRFQVIIHDGLHVVVSDDSKQVKPFLSSNGSNSVEAEIFYGRLCNRTTFEMARTLKDSYYLNFQCEKFEIDINGAPAVRATNFVQEIDLTFMREVTTLPVKVGRMIVE